ncbi:hypothetical protein NM688_g3796 [Phlebia brevispora]|uniref:Uncharacterized protein n=1 Tax=Phlebia brevispora TaxID=194682 RepID=A0ACC1T4H4_9APHY|nr:hypothetical protein NM688_g3796 [Phlebia brevispora]
MHSLESRNNSHFLQAAQVIASGIRAVLLRTSALQPVENKHCELVVLIFSAISITIYVKDVDGEHWQDSYSKPYIYLLVSHGLMYRKFMAEYKVEQAVQAPSSSRSASQSPSFTQSGDARRRAARCRHLLSTSISLSWTTINLSASASTMTIRLVLFDAFSTLLVPRLPVYVQYAQTFEPYLGPLDPDALKRSFKIDKPAYQSGAEGWWGEVIRRTAIGAGADPAAVDKSLGQIVPRLLKRFGSREGYRLFDDTLPCLKQLHAMNIRTGLVSNTDVRMRAVLEDLQVLPLLDPVLLSEEQGVEKPSAEMFRRARERAGVQLGEIVHVGDELKADYYGAKAFGVSALLLRRPGPDGEGEMKEEDEDLTTVDVVPSLLQVVEWVKERNRR